MFMVPIDCKVEEVSLSAPWNTFGKMAKALFDADPEIEVRDVEKCDDDDCADYVLPICVKNHDKYIALDRAMPDAKKFGNVFLRIYIIDATDENADQGVDIFKTIFAGNPILHDIKTKTDETGAKWNYCRFEPKVIQFFNDDLSDFSGNCTCLAQDIADELFIDKYGMNFCTAALDEDNEETVRF